MRGEEDLVVTLPAPADPEIVRGALARAFPG
jgi:hypothetical protein